MVCPLVRGNPRIKAKAAASQTGGLSFFGARAQPPPIRSLAGGAIDRHGGKGAWWRPLKSPDTAMLDDLPKLVYRCAQVMLGVAVASMLGLVALKAMGH